VRLFRSQPRIGLAGPPEAAALTALYARSWDANGGPGPDQGEVEAWLGGGFEVYRAVLDGRLAGAVRISFPTGAAMLDMLAVDPELRRRGVGRALVQHAISRGRKAGVRRAWAQLSPKLEEAGALFKSLGFRESLRHAASGGETTLLELML
jgi:ribosomal protein S18 acetylase RimI-like enzyme